jgi:hypothetical protein
MENIEEYTGANPGSELPENQETQRERKASKRATSADPRKLEVPKSKHVRTGPNKGATK